MIFAMLSLGVASICLRQGRGRSCNQGDADLVEAVWMRLAVEAQLECCPCRVRGGFCQRGAHPVAPHYIRLGRYGPQTTGREGATRWSLPSAALAALTCFRASFFVFVERKAILMSRDGRGYACRIAFLFSQQATCRVQSFRSRRLHHGQRSDNFLRKPLCRRDPSAFYFFMLAFGIAVAWSRDMAALFFLHS